ncbi:MAG: outer membrane beta-barrel protein [Candidatus Krumholzibacteriia bacterium]
MTLRVLLLGACVLMLPVALAAQSGDSFVPFHEIAFGLGWCGSTENDVFNVDGVGVGSSVTLGFAYYYNASRAIAVGFHIYGYPESLGDVVLEHFEGGFRTVDFDLRIYTFGPRVRWTFVRGSTFSPYAYAGIGLTDGKVDGGTFGSLQLDGWSVVGGVGSTLITSSHFTLSIEGILSSGRADWDEPPFRNSAGDDFDPSMFGILVNLAFLL